MSMPSTFDVNASGEKARRFSGLWSRIALTISAMTALSGLTSQAHATYPGENGVIVFETASTPASIGKVSPGSSAVTTLATGTMPKVSPNGQKVAFLRDGNLFVMNTDGSNAVQLNTGSNSQTVTWTRDGSKIAYTRLVSVGTSELWTINPNGTGDTRINNLAGDDVLSLEWSPSEDALLFEAGGTLWQKSPPNASSAVSAIFPATAKAHSASWAPDGESFLTGDPSQSLATAALFGALQAVPPAGTFTGRNAVSPDGTLIAGGILSNGAQLATRARAGTPTMFTWPTAVKGVDWGRVPKNCHASTPQGGGGVLGGDVDFYADQCAIAVMPNPFATGVLAQAVAVGTNGRLYGRTLKENPLGGGPVWGPFTVVPGLSGNPDGINPKKIAIAGAKDGSFQVVITLASDNTVAHAMQYANGSWSGFTRLDGFSGSPNFQARDVSITINGSTASSAGNAQVIANGQVGGSVFHRVRWPAGNWTPFSQVPGAEAMDTQALAIATSDDLYTNLLVITTNGTVRQVLRDPAGNWGGWVNVATPPGMQFNNASDVAVTRTELAGGQAYVMLLDSTSKAYLQVRNNPNLTSSWQGQLPTQLITTNGRSVSLSSGGFQSPILVTRAYAQ